MLTVSMFLIQYVEELAAAGTAAQTVRSSSLSTLHLFKQVATATALPCLVAEKLLLAATVAFAVGRGRPSAWSRRCSTAAPAARPVVPAVITRRGLGQVA